MDLQHAAAFVLFATVAAITPGPSNAMLTATGAASGVLRGLACLLGVATGMALMMLLAALGLAGALLTYPLLGAVLKACGAAFLLWLSWKIAAAPYSPGEPGGRPVGFAGALFFQWLNPKSWLVSAGAAGAYISADAEPLGQGLWLAGLFFPVAVLCGLPWLAFGALVRRWLRSPARQRGFNVAMGLVLAASTLLVL